MAATVEEMTVSINHVGDRAHEANLISIESGSLAKSGEAIIGQTVNDIHKISTTVNLAAERIHELVTNSQQISTVIAVIKEVADQTNLLALNAAIEAARAGEQGRGFAVVADEVRKLAERTSKSTQSIASVIEKVQSGARHAAQEMESGVNRVGTGVDLAQQAGDSIIGIQDGANRVATTVDDIGSALDEQSVAAQEIAQGVERIAHMAEENSVRARQTSVAAERLKSLASDLKGSVARFRV